MLSDKSFDPLKESHNIIPVIVSWLMYLFRNFFLVQTIYVMLQMLQHLSGFISPSTGTLMLV